MKKLFLVLVSILAIGLTQVQAQASSLNPSQTVALNPGTEAFEQMGSLRFRELSPVKDLGNFKVGLYDKDGKIVINEDDTRAEYKPFPTWSLNNPFTITYDNSGKILVTIGTKTPIEVQSNLTGMNYFQLNILARTAGSTVKLSDLSLTSGGATSLLGDISATSISNSWFLKDSSLEDGFTLSGNLELSGVYPTSQELNRVEFVAGHQAPVPEPSTMVLGALGLGGLLARRRKKA